MPVTVYNVTLFGLNFNVNPVAFTIPIGDGWRVYWYGIIIATGFLLAVLYGFFTAKRYNINVDRMIDVVLVTTPVAILCARAYYVIFDGRKLNGISDFFGFNGSGFSGLAIYGGVIGAFACGFLMCKLRHVNVLDMFDLAATGFILAQGIGRWGNFFNQEAYGTVTGSSWWGMTSERISSEMMTDALVHPCFLYESLWCIAGFFVLNFIGKKRRFKGQVVLSYCLWYGFMRGFLELIRTDSLMLGKLRISSLISFVLCIGAAILMYVILRRKKQQINDNTYEAMFGVLQDDAVSKTAEIKGDVEDGENN